MRLCNPAWMHVCLYATTPTLLECGDLSVALCGKCSGRVATTCALHCTLKRAPVHLLLWQVWEIPAGWSWTPPRPLGLVQPVVMRNSEACTIANMSKEKKEVRNPSEVIHLLSPDNRNQQSLMWRRSGNVSHSKACFQAETRWWGGDSDITGVTEWENVWREEGSTDSYSMYMGVCVLKMSAGPTHTHSRYRDVTSNTPCPSPACQCTSLSHAALVSSLH